MRVSLICRLLPTMGRAKGPGKRRIWRSGRAMSGAAAWSSGGMDISCRYGESTRISCNNGHTLRDFAALVLNVYDSVAQQKNPATMAVMASTPTPAPVTHRALLTSAIRDDESYWIYRIWT